MTERFNPVDADETAEVIRQAAARGMTLDVVAGASKRAIGRPGAASAVLDVTRLAGVVDYEPEELVLTARPGTPLAEVEALLAERGQHLSFEPPDLRALLGTPRSHSTLGGVVSANLAGPRRIKAGAVRDHVLGLKIVTGRGEAVKTGGRVVKNVTGYDLCKLLTGSWGTLAVLTEVSIRTMPTPETEETVIVEGLDDAAGVAVMTQAMGTPFDVSAAALLPGRMAGRCGLSGASATCLRLEGIAPSIAARRDGLAALSSRYGFRHVLEGEQSRMLWAAIRDVVPFQGDSHTAVWRISTAPSRAPAVVAAIAAQLPCERYYDWSGGLIWLSTASEGDAGAAAVRAAVAGNGHATLIRAPAAVRAAQPVFQPQPEALAALSRRVKDAFDPAGILNPGRMA